MLMSHYNCYLQKYHCFLHVKTLSEACSGGNVCISRFNHRKDRVSAGRVSNARREKKQKPLFQWSVQ